MNDRQIFFGVGVGILTALLGIGISQVSQSGWGLIAVGFVLTCLSVGVKVYSQFSGVHLTAVESNNLKEKEGISKAKALQEGDIRNAA